MWRWGGGGGGIPDQQLFFIINGKIKITEEGIAEQAVNAHSAHGRHNHDFSIGKHFVVNFNVVNLGEQGIGHRTVGTET